MEEAVVDPPIDAPAVTSLSLAMPAPVVEMDVPSPELGSASAPALPGATSTPRSTAKTRLAAESGQACPAPASTGEEAICRGRRRREGEEQAHGEASGTERASRRPRSFVGPEARPETQGTAEVRPHHACRQQGRRAPGPSGGQPS